MRSLLGISTVEKTFYELSKTNTNRQEYFFTYYSQKLILFNHIYPHIPEILHGYNDHGHGHIMRILDLYGLILKNNIYDFSIEEDPLCEKTLNFSELYLLLCGTIWHDVGNALGRESHGKKVTVVQERLKNNFFVDEDARNYARQIAEAHTGEDGIRRCIPDEDIDYQNHEVNLRFLGAILRFADELEEGEQRIDRRYYESMGDSINNDQKIYWEISKCIKRITPDPENCCININVRLKYDEMIKLFIKKSYEKVSQEVALIDELIYRIQKINTERKNYMNYVRKHLNYKEITLDLTIVDKLELGKITFRFNDDIGYRNFWTNFPALNPAEIIDSYSLIYGDSK
jgi:hypothetical protein